MCNKTSSLIKAVSLAAAMLPAIAAADELTIGARSELTMDPHFLWTGANTSYHVQIYGALLQLDAKAQVRPMLAESWRTVDDTTWEFKLREGVVFHDGTPFTAADVVATFKRLPNVPNAAGPLTGALVGIRDVVAVDDFTVHVLTNGPSPVVPHQVAQIPIIPSEIAESATTADFNTGKAAIGAGPFAIDTYVAGDRLELRRFDQFWGDKPEWERATFRFISDDSARVAAFLSGSVDMIDAVPPVDVSRLRETPEAIVHTGSSDRVIFLWMDHERDVTPFATDLDGKPLAKNPFKDSRVRRAINHAINRDVIVDRVMDKLAIPASQIVPPGFGGYDEAIDVPSYDPELAKSLLKEAGYPDGFGLTIHCPNDRYVNDGAVCQAVGQQLAQIGLKMIVEPMPRAVYFPMVTDHAGERSSLFLFGWGSSSGGEADLLWQGIHTFDKDKKLGTWNLGHYSNAEADALIEKALVTLDADERHRIEAGVIKTIMEDVAVVPLHYQTVNVATRKGLSYTVHADENTLITEVKKQP
ncbi:MAG TPA: ABC transporter substrate-binding protein [Rhizobiaceae bacterium]|nr:ABC transporter substrate-binding protein [Rhizobiaceae bacterium]